MKYYMRSAIDLKLGREGRIVDSETKEGREYTATLMAIHNKKEQRKKYLRGLPFFKRIIKTIFG